MYVHVFTLLRRHSPNLRKFGAVVKGVDLNDLDDESFQILRNALYTHSVLVLESLKDFPPVKQFELVHRFDPDANPTHGMGYGKSTKELGNLGVCSTSDKWL